MNRSSLVLSILNADWPVDASRPCSACAHRSTMSAVHGLRCLHPLSKIVEPVFALPPLCAEARCLGTACGPDGALHSMSPGTDARRPS